MMRRELPLVATWLLLHFGSSAYAESLAGDLIEQFHQGRSRWWYWRQVAIALVPSRAIALVRALVGTVALIMLGAGTLSWASTTRSERCAGICMCTPARAVLP
jgi:hypothetical protein